MKPYHWSEERARLNHDILCNQVLAECATLYLEPRYTSPIRLMLWLKQLSAFRELIDKAAEALDAGEIVDTPRFVGWPSQWREIFRPVFRDSFALANAIPQKIETLRESLTESEKDVRAFLATPVEERTSEQVRRFESHLRRLSQAISSLPRSIKSA
jgi:hypothetical protein